MSKPVIIDYYTDVLCVWAWIAQRRIDELSAQFQQDIQLRYLYVDVFGNTQEKMRKQWSERDGFNGFARHVADTAASFEDAPIHEKIWTEVRPNTSANAHLVLKAVEQSFGTKASVELALAIRHAFFLNAHDIGDLKVLCDIVTQQGLDTQRINHSINNGEAIAALMSDYQQAKAQNIKGSPSYVMDGGRQTLYGNVGYRVLHANIEQPLKQYL